MGENESENVELENAKDVFINELLSGTDDLEYLSCLASDIDALGGDIFSMF